MRRAVLAVLLATASAQGGGGDYTLELAVCDGEDVKQKWKVDGNKIEPSSDLKACVDCDTCTAGTEVRVKQCTGSSHQSWIASGGMTIQYSGNKNYCLQSSTVTAGASVSLVDCSKTAPTTWMYNPVRCIARVPSQSSHASAAHSLKHKSLYWVPVIPYV
jgi:hypothetical protein